MADSAAPRAAQEVKSAKSDSPKPARKEKRRPSSDFTQSDEKALRRTLNKTDRGLDDKLSVFRNKSSSKFTQPEEEDLRNKLRKEGHGKFYSLRNRDRSDRSFKGHKLERKTKTPKNERARIIKEFLQKWLGLYFGETEQKKPPELEEHHSIDKQRARQRTGQGRRSRRPSSKRMAPSFNNKS